MIIEACVETYEEALAAEKAGAGRIELCSWLSRDGLTPDHELIRKVCHALEIPVKVMIRPHDRSYRYTEEELKQMEADIRFCHDTGAAGVVFGMLGDEGRLDHGTIAGLAALTGHMTVTIHKVIDLTEDPLFETEILAQIPGVDSILTSGGKETAEEGADTIRQMIAIAGNRLEIIAAGRVTNENLAGLHAIIHAPAYHGRKIVSSGT